MYLHENRELFDELINASSDYMGVNRETIEKDYYVTILLRKLAETQRLPCVFKGGTSLSKCFHCIDRFSEDIDITFAEHLGKARRKQLKYNVMKPIADELGLSIRNWDSIESNKDYNAYYFSYPPISEYAEEAIRPEVRLETALVSYAFPTEIKSVGNILYDYLMHDNRELIEEFGLAPFDMRVQSLSRTFIDKVFALCDYYMQGKSKRYSRHLYDLYKIFPRIAIDDELKELVEEVRQHRSTLSICPSAQPDVNIYEKIMGFCDDNFYKEDYDNVTSYFISEMVPYENIINNMKEIADKLF